MSVIVIQMDQLPAAFQNERAKINGAMKKAARAAAQKLKAFLVDEVDSLGITYQGIYRNSFVVKGNEVSNNAPHAGIIELGARPHAVSEEGFQAIKEWVRVKLLGRPAENWNDLKKAAKDRIAGKTNNIGGLNALLGVKSEVDEAEGIARAIVNKIRREGQKPKYVMRNALPKATAYFKQELERIIAEESIKTNTPKSWEGLKNEAKMRSEGLGSLNTAGSSDDEDE